MQTGLLRKTFKNVVFGLTVLLAGTGSLGYRVAPLLASTFTYEDLLSVSFPDELNGWACGRWGLMLRSTDGGLTWAAQRSGTSCTLASVHFVDKVNGWAVGDEGTIIHTRDGGRTWIAQQSPARFYLMDVHFLNPMQGYIVTEHTYIFYTDDGGVNWGTMFSDDDFILKGISFCDSQHGWAVGEYGFIYHTSNGGAVWEKQAGEYGFSGETGEVIGGTFLFDVQAVDPDTAWAVGIDSHVIRTEDGGRTWEKLPVPGRKTQLFCVSTGPGGRVVIGGNGLVLVSEDNGRSWVRPQFEPPASYGWFYGLDARNGMGFVAVGWEGAIYKTGGLDGKLWRLAER